MSFNNVLFRNADAVEAASQAVRNFAFGEPQEVIQQEQIAEPAPPQAEEVKPEVKEAVQAETPSVTPSVTPEPVKYDWKSEIKKVDRKELLKEAGLDDFVLGMLEYREKTGDFTPYLEAKTVDYTKMEAQDLLKLDMKRQNPGMSERALNFKFNKELNDKYFLDRDVYPEDSDEAQFGQEQLRLDAEKKRAEFIDYQNKFKAPERELDKEAADKEAAMQQQLEKISGFVSTDQATVALKTSKSLTFGEGEGSFTLPVDDAEVMFEQAKSILSNNGVNDFSSVNLNAFYKSMAIGKDVDGFLAKYSKHVEALAHKKFQSELQNVSPTNTEQNIPPAEAPDKGWK